MANIFMKQIVSKCTHGIDLHTGAIHRTNLPQIRASLDDPETDQLARGFGVPVIIDSKLRDGSLREAARKKRVSTLLFEGGEALRFDENIIRIGLNGCLSVMRNIGMLPKARAPKSEREPKVFVAQQSYWIRASHSGSFTILKKIGDKVDDGETIAVITDPFGDEPYEIVCQEGGIVIGLSTIPLVNKGDAVAHIATFKYVKRVKQAIDLLEN
jgi:predicted deacylase